MPISIQAPKVGKVQRLFRKEVGETSVHPSATLLLETEDEDIVRYPKETLGLDATIYSHHRWFTSKE